MRCERRRKECIGVKQGGLLVRIPESKELYSILAIEITGDDLKRLISGTLPHNLMCVEIDLIVRVAYL